ncbi:hypothetical protein A33Q_2297 [Indibacter alkaliphilus LW1]|uniref:Uncharacterized protein n=1 Tax=Indibacter alkaliphilus (strain CCUG 57479 / KCTC 22604 / LW1) TaxID=1189612 RepID=S2DBH4_INDAL|nr:hypothetical protein A33Q_2297 [Indibacter alkaliphilus LW1]
MGFKSQENKMMKEVDFEEVDLFLELLFSRIVLEGASIEK